MGLEMENIVKHFNELNEETPSVTLPYTFTLHSLIGNINIDRFYTYRGKVLTAHKCSVMMTGHDDFRLTNNTEMQ